MGDNMVLELLLELGYNDGDIKTIIDKNKLNNCKMETLYLKINEISTFLLDFGYSKKELIKITRSCPFIYGYSAINLENKINYLRGLGLDDKEIIKITKRCPEIYGYGIDNLDKKINDMVTLGYQREDVIKMIKKVPMLFGVSINNMKDKIKGLQELGYSRGSIINMTKVTPSLYNYSIDTIKGKFNFLCALGYTKDEVIKMTMELSTMYNLNVDSTAEKLAFYKSIGLRDVMIKKSKNLMQSLKLSYARYRFFQDCDIEVNIDNYKILFDSEKRFYMRNGISNSELLTMYDYDEEILNVKSDEKRKQN